MLIDNLKFDLRIYILLYSVDPLRIYYFDEGLARFATEEYKMPNKKNLNNFFMHLTNYAINARSKKFVFNNSVEDMDKGHKRSYSSFINHIRDNYP